MPARSLGDRPTVLVAPDKFRGSLTAAQAATAIGHGVQDARPKAEVILVPIADGGEGSVAACLAHGYRPVTIETRSAAGAPVRAQYATDGATAVVELAQASGLALAGPSRRTARHGSTEGTGDLIRHAMEAGATTVVLAVGGSATTDGGTGIAAALGIRFLDADRRPVPPGADGLARIVSVDTANRHPGVATTEFILAVDVAVPLTGPTGAARQFAGQKGASTADVADFERGLRHLAAVIHAATGTDIQNAPGAGAAGGVAATSVPLLGARIRSGAAYFLDLLGFDAALDAADLLITGEGHVDEQTLAGKGPAEAVKRAVARGTPAVMVAGRISLTAEQLARLGVDAAGAIAQLETDPGRQRSRAGSLLRRATAGVLQQLAGPPTGSR